MTKSQNSDEEVFVAYPDGQLIVTDAIAGAVGLSAAKSLKLKPWAAMKIYGIKIDGLIRESIDGTRGLIADITVPNFNVYYEIGYAIGRKKPIILTVNTGHSNARGNAHLTGLFDSFGYLEYQNADELSEKLDDWTMHEWSHNYDKGKDHSQPMFILDTLVKIDFRQFIFHEVENQEVNCRTFDPAEVPRLTADHAIGQIAASSGCIIPLINDTTVDFQKHNLRGAFLAGLCHGYGINPLIIQYDGGPAPLDYRDFITNSNSRRETLSHVEDYCKRVLIKNQQYHLPQRRYNLGILSKIDLGSSAAENDSAMVAENYGELRGITN